MTFMECKYPKGAEGSGRKALDEYKKKRTRKGPVVFNALESSA